MRAEEDAFWRQRWKHAGAHVGFLLLPHFSMLELSCAIDLLRIARRLGSRDYRWTLLSADGARVTASNGIALDVAAGLRDGVVPDILFAMASYEPLQAVTPAIEHGLRRMARHGVLLGAVDTGVFVLARAGLLAGRSVTLHWESQAAFIESFPDISVTSGLYVFDRDRLTGAGGAAVIDMMLFFIALQHDDDLARAVAEQIVHPPMRAGEAAQRLSVAGRYALRDQRIARAVTLMEVHVEHPLTMEGLARAVGLSQRQFERLCHMHLGRSGKSFYLTLRLERARQMLTDSGLDVAGAALATGFENAAHFSRLFRRVFGVTPTQLRATGMRIDPKW
ncbi:GlxA family transcriptional regulator [Gluconacetobacter tumulicola]|uniref:GlxA family transcriptional regulator n=1 Tax=Gluconacetobacter tumulicola TaxID=1017177 RepID=A0A7W4PB03_9PROT|nr:GlxA family transcriptional regulator [Gluconacetobacter tumulicola]MBB2180630.1 GlxA family transcriptional regulator [Gluconacetobacter tumulicola]